MTAVVVFAGLTSSPTVAQTSDDVDHAEADRDVAYSRVLKVESDLDRTLLNYERVHSLLEALELKVERTEKQLREFQTSATELSEVVKLAVIDAYAGSGVADLDVSLNTKTFQDLLMARYLGGKLREAQQADLKGLLAVGREIDRLQTSLDSDRADMQITAQSAREAAEAVQTSLDAAEHELEDAERRFVGIKAEFEAEQQRKREAELARIRASQNVSARGLEPTATSDFVCPVQGGARFINSWGFPRSGGRTHKGVDMFAKRGTPTPAVTAGIVRMRTVNLGGTVSYLYGDDGNKYYYAHLDGYPAGLQDGQRVERGQAIGFVGNSGNAEGTSPHLHFEIRPGGANAVNPYPTVRPACP